MRKEVIFLYKDSRLRREALAGVESSGFSLYGLPEFLNEGKPVRALAEEMKNERQMCVASILRYLSFWWAGYHGNPKPVVGGLSKIRKSAGVVATSNNIGISLLLLKRFGIVKVPVLLVSVGLEAFQEDIDNGRRRRLKRLLEEAETIIVFSMKELEFLENRFGDLKNLRYVPFGFERRYFSAVRSLKDSGDALLTVGADGQRDIELLREWSLRHPSQPVECVFSRDLIGRVPDIPESWNLSVDVSLDRVLEKLGIASRVAIPVKENHYSAGTTFLIQALSAGIPTLVAKTAALEGMTEAEPFPFLTYKPGCIESFNDGMSRLLNLSESECSDMSRSCRAWIEKWGDGRFLKSELESFIELCSAA